MIAFLKIDVEAESRFFLQAFLCMNYLSLEAPYKIKSVAKQLCLTERFVRDASQELVRARLLREIKQEGGVGRLPTRQGERFSTVLSRTYSA